VTSGMSNRTREMFETRPFGHASALLNTTTFTLSSG